MPVLQRASGLSASSLPAIQPQVMKDGYILDRATQLSLVKLVTVEEVYQDAHYKDGLKAPGHDGFNT